ncbi:Qat anti-phage system TatD family nuclease QatD [Orenia marismortui]|uniref:Qat anti-phage system TatD family nuclease QatD n=1 Tax=Orenia marismortui TaxID=46469 RepID=UPI0003732B17|nr:Qat anti-phage system TatD family nuclease QatD [Orenia marismortui]
MNNTELSYLDAHYHLDLSDNPKSMVDKIEKNKVYTIAMTNAPSVFTHTQKLVSNKKFVRAAIGLHPQLAISKKHELDLFNSLLPKTRYVGEIGLDYTKNSLADRDIQIQVFKNILDECAKYGNKVLSVHSRNSAKDVINIIGNDYPGKVILHWYSGGITDLKTAINFGFYFSVNHSMISSQKGKKIISKIPVDRILTETDGPFIKINKKPSCPTDIDIVIKKLAILLDKDIVELKRIILNNLKNLLEG